jgi:CBS domain containing-hemolysin-like protein
MEISIIIIGLILSAFFSGMEVAFVSANKIYLEINKKQNDFFSNILTKLTEKPSQYILSMLIGKNLAIVVVVYYMRILFLESDFYIGLLISKEWGLVLRIFLLILLLLIVTSFLPKVLFKIYANGFMKFFALPAYFFYLIFHSVSSFFIWISNLILKKFGKTNSNEIPLFLTKIELGNYISEQIDTMVSDEGIDSEIQIFQNALEFSGVKAREIMSPRAELAAVALGSTVDEMKDLFIETGYSKILVFKNSIDNIVGFVHSFDLFKKPSTINEVLISVEYVPGTIYIKDVLDLLIKKRKSIAVVLDEYGGTAGIITVEDIVEELFGEIEDEHDLEENFLIQEIDSNLFLLSTQLKVEYLNQTYEFNIPESHSYTTLGGYIVNFTKEIPEIGQEISIDTFHFTIETASNKKIELVKMRLNV